jgi:hypothetical protein
MSLPLASWYCMYGILWRRPLCFWESYPSTVARTRFTKVSPEQEALKQNVDPHTVLAQQEHEEAFTSLSRIE